MPLGGGMSCVKYLLFAFNLLFAVSVSAKWFLKASLKVEVEGAMLC